MIETAYQVIVAQSRLPQFYIAYGLADTSDNRREWIGCHAALVMMRWHRCGPDGEKAAQALFDWMFADIEQNFREQGVSDMSIGKHIKKASITFLARYQSMDGAIQAKDEPGLAGIFARNMDFSKDDGPAGMAGYVLRAFSGLEAVPNEACLADAPVFPARP